VIGIFDILGAIGGLYELFAVTSSILFKIVFEFQMKRDIQKEHKKEKSEDWFSYPALSTQGYNLNKFKKKKRRKVFNGDEQSNENNVADRSLIYRELKSKITSGNHLYYISLFKN